MTYPDTSDGPAYAAAARAAQDDPRAVELRDVWLREIAVRSAMEDWIAAPWQYAQIAQAVLSGLAQNDPSKPPPGPPKVLSSADDVARVCEAAGLGGYTRVIGGITVGRWGVERTELVVLTADDEVLVWNTTVAGRPVIIPLGQSSAVLWSAIRAARGEA